MGRRRPPHPRHASVACRSDGDTVRGEEPGTVQAETSDGGSVTATPRADLAVTPAFGTAGLIPRNYPEAGEADWVAMYEAAADAGSLLGLYGGWNDGQVARGEVPEVFRAGYAAADRFGGFTPIVAVGFASEDILTGAMRTTLDWSNPTEVAAFSAVAVAIAGKHQPPFFIVGAEINRIWEQHPDDYAAFVAAWPTLYQAIKAAAPATEVGVSFQYEFLRGAGYLSGQTRAPQWELLEPFADHSDFVGLSTYPFFDFETPGAIPDDYYREFGERSGLPIAFTEMGWPSRPLSNFPDSGYGGSEAEQAAFATRFLDLIEGLDVRFALWSFQHDLGSPGGPAFESIALRENDGTPKPALEVWIAASR